MPANSGSNAPTVAAVIVVPPASGPVMGGISVFAIGLTQGTSARCVTGTFTESLMSETALASMDTGLDARGSAANARVVVPEAEGLAPVAAVDPEALGIAAAA